MSEQATESLAARAKALTQPLRAALGKMPLPLRVAVLSAVGLVLVGGSVFLPRLFAESYAPLFAQLDPGDSGAVTAKLKELKIPYRADTTTGAIEVPEARVHDVRLELAGAGLPRGGGVGFESFDKMRLGATDFEQRVLYRRSLEGELARTIGSLAAVQSARVHLVMPEKSVFVSKSEPASASIVVKLRPGRTLGASEVAGIVHLTSSSTPGLAGERITLLSADGTVLHRPRREGGIGGDDGTEAFGQARTVEAALEERARAMLARIVGPEQVDVRVSAELDVARIERTEDRFDPSRAVLRSEERSTERATPSESVAGVPGAEANLPGGAGARTAAAATAAAAGDGGAPVIATASAPASASAGAGTLRESHTRNFEVDRVVEKRTMAGATLKRLTVAVAVDGHHEGGNVAPRSKEELEKIAHLVRSAVGLSEGRGDKLTVESVAFARGEAPRAEPVAATGVPVAKVLQLLRTKRGMMVGAGIAAFFTLLTLVAVVRARRRRRRLAREAADAAFAAKALAAGATDDGETEHAGELGDGATPLLGVGEVDPREAVHERVLRDPATAALVVRGWLGTSEAEERLAS